MSVFVFLHAGSGQFWKRSYSSKPLDPVLCDFYTLTIRRGNLPHIGKHPSSDIVKGCGELQPAAASGAAGSKTSSIEDMTDQVEAVA